MPLLPILSQVEQDLTLLDSLIVQSAEAAHHLAVTMGRCNAELWSLPDERLGAVLNADRERTAAIFAANSFLGSAVNAALDNSSIAKFSSRAPLTPGREISVGESGEYVVIPIHHLPMEGISIS